MKTETVDVPNSERRHFRPTEIRPVRRDPGLQVCSGLHEGEQASFSATNELGCSDGTVSLTCDTCWFILYLASSEYLVLPHGTYLSFCAPMTIQESRVENRGTKQLCSPGWTIPAPAPASLLGIFGSSFYWKAFHLIVGPDGRGLLFSSFLCFSIFKVTLILGNVGHDVFRCCFSEDFPVFP